MRFGAVLVVGAAFGAPLAFAATPYEVKDRLLGRFEEEVRDSRHDTVDVLAAEGRIWLVGKSTSKKRIDAYLKLAEETARGFEVVNRIKKVAGSWWDTGSEPALLGRGPTGDLAACEALAPTPGTRCVWSTRVPHDGLRGYALSPQGRRAHEAQLDDISAPGIEVGLPWHWRGNGGGEISGFAPHLIAPAVRLRVRKAAVRVTVGNGTGGRPEIGLEGTEEDRSRTAVCTREGPIAGTIFVDCWTLDDPTIGIVVGVSTGVSIEAEEVELHLKGTPAYLGLKAVRADFFAEISEDGAAVLIESVMEPGSVETPEGYRPGRNRRTSSYEWNVSSEPHYGLSFGRVFLRSVQVGTVRIEEIELDEAFPARSHWQALPQHRVRPKRELIDRTATGGRTGQGTSPSDFGVEVERVQTGVRVRNDVDLSALLEKGELAVEIDGQRVESVVFDRVTEPPELLVVVDCSGSMTDRWYELTAQALEGLEGRPVITTATATFGQVVVMTRRTDKYVAAEAIRNAPTPAGPSLIREAAVLSVDLARAVDLPDHWRLVLVTDLLEGDDYGVGRVSGAMVRRALAETPELPVVLAAKPTYDDKRDRQFDAPLRSVGAVFRSLSDTGALREELAGARYLVTAAPPEGRSGLLPFEILAGAGLELEYRREVWVR